METTVTLVVTTSPLPRHPCTHMLEQVIGSIHRHCPGVHGCRLLIVADGYEVVGPGERSRFKRGKVSAEVAHGYETYKRVLRELCAKVEPYLQAELIEQPYHRGFALCVCRGVRAARTPFVLVVQHDRPLIRRAPLPAILSAMLERPRLVHVNLSTGRTLPAAYEQLAASKYAIRLEPLCMHEADLRFLPLLQFYDSTHLARRDSYLDLFGRYRFRNGDFIEDTLGQGQLHAIRRDGLAVAHSAFRTPCWVVDDGDATPMVSHLDGRDLLVMEKFDPTRPHSRSAPARAAPASPADHRGCSATEGAATADGAANGSTSGTGNRYDALVASRAERSSLDCTASCDLLGCPGCSANGALRRRAGQPVRVALDLRVHRWGPGDAECSGPGDAAVRADGPGDGEAVGARGRGGAIVRVGLRGWRVRITEQLRPISCVVDRQVDGTCVGSSLSARAETRAGSHGEEAANRQQVEVLLSEFCTFHRVVTRARRDIRSG